MSRVLLRKIHSKRHAELQMILPEAFPARATRTSGSALVRWVWAWARGRVRSNACASARLASSSRARPLWCCATRRDACFDLLCSMRRDDAFVVHGELRRPSRRSQPTYHCFAGAITHPVARSLGHAPWLKLKTAMAFQTLNGVLQTMHVKNSAMCNRESIHWNGSQS